MKNNTLAIGIFFDGTGNNAFNTDSGPSHRFSSDSESYRNSHTNIYRLFQRYQKEGVETGERYRQAGIYIEGVGTARGQQDRTVPDMSFGTGEQGVASKVEQSITRIRQVLAAASLEVSFSEITTITFDIFGFSRGATAARHLANLLHQDIGNKLHTSRRYLNHPSLAPLLLRIRFIGLFDTVAAIALPANGMSTRSKNSGEIMLYLPIGIASRVFHIAAEHECRYNFPLSSVKPYYPELFLPGVHSDIGGGYQDEQQEDLLLSQPAYNTVTDSSPIEQTRIYQQTQREKTALENHVLWGPVMRSAEMSICHWQRPVPEDKRLGMMKQVATAVRVRRRVKNTWAYISLLVMLDAAKDAGCHFDSHGIKEKIPASLDSILTKIIIQGRSLRAGKSFLKLNSQEIGIISRDYIHCSAHWNEVLLKGKGLISGQRLVSEQPSWPVKPFKLITFINRPEENWQRTIIIY